MTATRVQPGEDHAVPESGTLPAGEIVDGPATEPGEGEGSRVVEIGALQLRRLWIAVLAEVESQVSPTTFATWFQATMLRERDDTRFTVACQTNLTVEQLRNRHLRTLESAIGVITGLRAVRVEFVVDESLSQADLFEDEPSAPRGVLEIDVRQPQAAGQNRGRIENNLGRRAVFALSGGEGGEDSEVGSETVRDIIGNLTREYTWGRLKAREMDICTWLGGQWDPSNGGVVSFTLRELQRGLGISWNGQLGRELRDALRRMKGTTITGRFYDRGLKRYKEHSYNIIDELWMHDVRNSIDDDDSPGGRITLRLGNFMVRQFENGQYAELDMDKYRHEKMARYPKCRRLYQFLECEEGDKGSDGQRVTVEINPQLGATLGSKDAELNPSRFRRDLLTYGEIICEVSAGLYRQFRLRQGSRRNEWYLIVERSPAWKEQRERQRRAFLTERGRALAAVLAERQEQGELELTS